MELKELRSIIKQFQNLEVINNVELSITFETSNTPYHFTGLLNIYKFYKEQSEKWNTIVTDGVGDVFEDSVSFFNSAIENLDSFIEDYLIKRQANTDDFNYYFQQLESDYLNPDKNVYTADSSEVAFLQNLADRSIELVLPASNYFTASNIIPNSKINIQGYILAYEFQNKENSVLFNNRETEKRHLNKIRADLSSVKDLYENEVISFQKQIESDYRDYKGNQDTYISNSKETLAKWLLFKKGRFNELYNVSVQDINNLQNQYGELLKLEEPVKYWRDRADLLNNKANILLWWIVGMSLLFAGLVYVLLWFTPEGLLESLFSGDKSKAIRWSFVFIIFISIFFVVIKALLKFMFSNFHLARDAEEREKLTYLYISLLSKGEVSEEERKIVFQALFSRSDTGLLKEDSSPTMPGVASYIDRLK